MPEIHYINYGKRQRNCISDSVPHVMNTSLVWQMWHEVAPWLSHTTFYNVMLTYIEVFHLPLLML